MVVGHQVEIPDEKLHDVFIDASTGFESFAEFFICDMIFSKVNKRRPDDANL
jgi:hypothetical protein